MGQIFEKPIIDVEKTSIKLKEIREAKGTKISQLQHLFSMENPQSIYNWENPNKKNLPRIDNLVTLAQFYNVKIDDLIIVKYVQTDMLEVCDSSTIIYGIKIEYIENLISLSSSPVLKALKSYYNFST
jgi:transcriptional regulator with XRE-family HTH domain